MMTFPVAMMSANCVFIIRWKTAGALRSPNGITVGSNSPMFVLKAAFSSSPSLKRMLLYPARMSIFVKSRASQTLHQCFDGLLDPPWTSLGQLGPAGASWCQLVQHPKVSKLPCPQAMSKSSTISSQSDDQQVGKFHKFGKSIW